MSIGGFALYARLLNACARTPATNKQISDSVGLGINNTRFAMRGMHDGGIVHIHGWVGRQPVWAAGPGDDAPGPTATCVMQPPPKFNRTVDRFCIVTKALIEDGPMTTDELSESSGVNETCVKDICNILHDDVRLAYYQAFRRRYEAGPYARVFAWGIDQRDARRPRRLTPSQISRRYELRKRARRDTARVLFAIAGARPALARLQPTVRITEVA